VGVEGEGEADDVEGPVGFVGGVVVWEGEGLACGCCVVVEVLEGWEVDCGREGRGGWVRRWKGWRRC